MEGQEEQVDGEREGGVRKGARGKGYEETEEEKDNSRSRLPYSKIETAALTLRYKLSAS